MHDSEVLGTLIINKQNGNDIENCRDVSIEWW